MGKRSNLLVVLSSDEDDDENDDLNKSCKSSNTKSNSRDLMCHSKIKSTNSSSRRNSSAKSTRKKSRLSDSLSSSVNLFPDFHADEFLSHGIAEEFAGFKVSTGCSRLDVKESWVDKYKPCSLEELAVHKKKVEEVKMWFEQRLRTSKKGILNYALVITGQAGTGKSATVHVIASHFGAEVCEWNTPTPTIWQEHVHNLNSGMRYISKLDEFEIFVDRVRKYGLLSSSVTSTRSPLILLIEDLPVANGKVAQGRLFRCLQHLVKSVQIPTVILMTDYSRADSGDVSVQYWEEVSSSLGSAGAFKVAFNPVTVSSAKKVLSRICKEEKCIINPEQIDLIANASGGDIRNAIMSLQYFCLNQETKVLVSSEKGISSSEAKLLCRSQKDCGSLPIGKDLTLSLFHALGKFLHNKREVVSTTECDENIFDLKEEFTRLPLKMDAPEKVLCQAYGQARPVAEFLHENVLDFLSEEAIEDAWVVTSYLSDADCLLASAHRTFTRSYEAENVVQSAGASVSVRGVLFGNAHPSPSRWHAIRRPMLWQVEQSVRQNMVEMERQRVQHHSGLNLSNASAFCIEYRPALKWLGYRSSLHSVVHNSSIQGVELENELDLVSSQEIEIPSSDDEIEDW